MSPAQLNSMVAGIADEILARAARKSGGARSVRATVARIIDHTILKPEAAEADVRRICGEAREYGFASVCVNPYWVPLVAHELHGAEVAVCTVVGFPLGANTTETKMAETAGAIRSGAREIDMVMNVGAMRSGNVDAVRGDILGVVGVAHASGAIVKVILETALLSDDQKIVACKIAQEASADFVKTSTGFGPGGATTADIALMRATVGPDMGVKASGGIRTIENLRDMVAAGASRIGASAGVQMVQALPA